MTSSPEDPDESPVSELSYTEASLELDEIVEFFEHRDVDVDQLVARLERATALSTSSTVGSGEPALRWSSSFRACRRRPGPQKMTPTRRLSSSRRSRRR